ncbi:hypothetical protein PanWU01x14_233050 [Parasponia andersonii]|uniref:F-box protein At3g26010-like beta-propeller domain-containing protein n=1 Tax=Parasponia andersonii TaxID=3476 RepID=A0A2P5BJS3_PARAD|nr:hypothetical protein PanWU01x14_233050 [Parasponia andersonii]
MSSLTDDLLIEILTQMSDYRDCPFYYRDLAKFPSYDLFSEASKILHGQSSTRTSPGKYLDFLGWPNPIVRASDKDLLLLERTPLQFCICNPLTKQSVALPEAPPCKYLSFGFVCESNGGSTSTSTSVVIKYRVVLITSQFPNVVFSFSSEKGEWKQLRPSFPKRKRKRKREQLGYLFQSLSNWDDKGIVCNGVMYRLLSYYYKKYEAIVAFDPFEVGKKASRFISFPAECYDGIERKRGVPCLGLVRGRLRLSLSFWYGAEPGFTLKSWELSLRHDDHDHQDTWALVQNVKVNVTVNLAVRTYLIGLHPEDGDVFFFLDEKAGIIYKYQSGQGRL